MLLAIFTCSIIAIQSCNKEELKISADQTILTLTNLSEYNIYQGNPTDLIPTSEFKLYELSSQLFTDYAEKQRLIKLPPGTSMEIIDNGLLNFPEGTIIAKTFYYFKDKRNPSLGKKLIETRILEKTNGKWVVGTYIWNDSQSEAHLVTSGYDKIVNWIDSKGSDKVITYHIPNNMECKTCHNISKEIQPIGPKTKNLNFEVIRDSTSINQLDHLFDLGLVNSVSPNSYIQMADYNDDTRTIQERGRAYLDINCAHCHSDKGFASDNRYRMNYETDLNSSKIKEGKVAIKYMLEEGDMPKIGTTLIDKEGVNLIKKYLETL